jgi:hypothetical protein
MTPFAAVQATRCFSPAKSFRTADEALAFAANAARMHRIGYAVWERNEGRPRLVTHNNLTHRFVLLICPFGHTLCRIYPAALFWRRRTLRRYGHATQTSHPQN